jgi:hypothetical protein
MITGEKWSIHTEKNDLLKLPKLGLSFNLGLPIPHNHLTKPLFSVPLLCFMMVIQHWMHRSRLLDRLPFIME